MLDSHTINQCLRSHGVRRTEYAQSVLQGRVALSGADLQGKAKRYGGSYYRTRCAAVAAAIADGIAHVRREPRTGRLTLRPGMCGPEGALLGKPCACASEVWEY